MRSKPHLNRDAATSEVASYRPATDNEARRRDLARTQEVYDENPFGEFSYGAKRVAHNRPLVDFLASLDGSEMLFDVGCGAGYWHETAARRNLEQNHSYGLDLSFASARLAKRKGVMAVCGSALELPFGDAVSDATICNGVIQCAPDPFQAFKELVRITKPGGRILLSSYNRWNPYFWLVRGMTVPLRYIYWNVSKK